MGRPPFARIEAGNGVSISGAELERCRDFPARFQPNPAPVLSGPDGGWVVHAGWNNPSSEAIVRFTTTWKVPDPPAVNSKQLLYLFNGMQISGSELAILQPVLSWYGAEPNPQWRIASYYVTGDNVAFRTYPKPVAPGTALTGIISLAGRSPSGLFNYQCEFAGIQETILMADNIPELVSLSLAFEAYYCRNEKDYPAPASTVFDVLALETARPPFPPVAWTGIQDDKNSTARAIVSSPTQIEIRYR